MIVGIPEPSGGLLEYSLIESGISGKNLSKKRRSSASANASWTSQIGYSASHLLLLLYYQNCISQLWTTRPQMHCRQRTFQWLQKMPSLHENHLMDDDIWPCMWVIPNNMERLDRSSYVQRDMRIGHVRLLSQLPWNMKHFDDCCIFGDWCQNWWQVRHLCRFIVCPLEFVDNPPNKPRIPLILSI